MYNIIKKLSAVLLAATLAFACPLSVEAKTITTKGDKVYVQSDSGKTSLYTGWLRNSSTGKRYYFKKGELKTSCWIVSNGKRTYYVRKDGSMATGKVVIGGVEYEFGSNGKLITDEYGINLTVSNVNASKGLTLAISFDRPADDCDSSLITKDGVYASVSCCNEYTIEKYSSSKGWEDITSISSKMTCNDEFTDMGSDGYTESVKWNKFRTTLKSGNYRISKNLFIVDKDGTIAEKTYYGYFSV